MKPEVPLLAFVSGMLAAFAILPFGLTSPMAIPLALGLGAIVSGLGAYFADRPHSRLAPPLVSSLASLALAVPIGALLIVVVGTNLVVSAIAVFAVVALASAFAEHRFRGPIG